MVGVDLIDLINNWLLIKTCLGAWLGRGSYLLESATHYRILRSISWCAVLGLLRHDSGRCISK